MNWRHLAAASQIYTSASSYDEHYQSYMNDRDAASWWSPQGPGTDEARRMFRFLNQWKCRLRNNESDCARLSAAAADVVPLLSSLRGETLGEVALTDSVMSAVTEAFHITLDALYKRSGTCVSKILHMYNPRLFVMWDDAIRGGYAVEGDGHSYGAVFLPHQQLAREAIASVITEGLAGPSDAVTYIESQCAGNPLAKVMDEFNYCKFTRRDAVLWSPLRSELRGASA